MSIKNTCLSKYQEYIQYDAKDWFKQSGKSAMEKKLNEGEDRRRVLNAWT